METKDDPFLAVEDAVAGVPLSGKSSKDQVILFMPRSATAPKLGPLRVADFVHGETYVVSVFLIHAGADCNVAGDAKHQAHGSTAFVLHERDIKDLADGVAVIPIDTLRDKLREQFITGP